MPRTKKSNTEGKETKVEVKKKTSEPSYYAAIGRRKEAVASVRLYVGDGEIKVKEKAVKKGEMMVNNRLIEDYFKGEVYSKLYFEPFRTTNTVGRFSVVANIIGGGISGQLGAFVHGVSRALEKIDKEKFRPILKKKGFMTRDSRTKQRRKAGFAQKSRAKKQSPKR